MKDRVKTVLKKLTVWDYLLLAMVMAGLTLVLPVIIESKRKEAPVIQHWAKDGPSGKEVLVWVDISGGVEKPGAYQLNDGNRVKDAVVAAGGLSSTADRVLVAKMINLAEKLKDGQKIYIPEVNTQIISSGGSLSAVKGTTTSTLININTAGENDLDKLWGIGVARAGEIIAGRPYKSVDELLSRKILTKSVFDRNKELFTVY